MRAQWVVAIFVLACAGCQPYSQEASVPKRQSFVTDTDVVLMVGVAKDGMLKQQVVHAYKTRELKEHRLVVPAGATLTILESNDRVSRVHFMTNAWTPDYKTTIPQAEAIGWIATGGIVRIKKEQENAQPKDALDKK